MEIFQASYQDNVWSQPLPKSSSAQLVLVFGAKARIREDHCKDTLIQSFPNADVIACSTSGEIHGIRVFDDSLCVTALSFDDSSVETFSVHINDVAGSASAGVHLARKIDPTNLKHVMIFSDGQHVNGSKLVKGLESHLPKHVSVTGGLAGDGDRFEETWLWHNQISQSGLIIVCAFYGEKLQVGCSSFAGWDVFGPDRLITKADGNVLHELDNESALDLYKRYLGDSAAELPGSALLFPLFVHKKDAEDGVIRTILNIDEVEKSMTFAGDLVVGDYAQLMHANLDRLVDGSEMAAKNIGIDMSTKDASIAILISCVGRKLVLNQRAEEELEVVSDIFGPNVALCGFYSYGEISPLDNSFGSALHNQTMTITTFSEK